MVWSEPAGLQAWARSDMAGEVCGPYTLLAAPGPPREEIHTLGTPELCSTGKAI